MASPAATTNSAADGRSARTRAPNEDSPIASSIGTLPEPAKGSWAPQRVWREAVRAGILLLVSPAVISGPNRYRAEHGRGSVHNPTSCFFVPEARCTVNRDFIGALLQLNAEKGVPKEILIETLEQAIESAYRRNADAPENVVVIRTRAHFLPNVVDY